MGVAPTADRGVLILAGPTASGKTAFGIALAERYGAEIVGADSRQIYRGMPIGTAAPTPAEQARVPHHLVGQLDPFERYTAARFVIDAAASIAEIHGRCKRVIVAGGTGFYLRALAGDVALADHADPAVRSRVLREAQTHPIDVLYGWLQARDPRRAAALSAHDPYRIVRALEIDLARGNRHAGPARERALPTLRAAGLPFVKLALRVDMAVLEPRIAARTDAMLAAGLIEEAERIGEDAVAADAVGYRDACAYRRGWLTNDELRRLLVRTTRRYAKRQLTWFRGEPDIRWIDAGDFAAADAAVASIGWGFRR